MDISSCSCLVGMSHECQHKSNIIPTQARLIELLEYHIISRRSFQIWIPDPLFQPELWEQCIKTKQEENTSSPFVYMSYLCRMLASMISWFHGGLERLAHGSASNNHITAVSQAEVKHVHGAPTRGKYVIQLTGQTGTVDGYTCRGSNDLLKRQILDISHNNRAVWAWRRRQLQLRALDVLRDYWRII